MTPLVIAGLCLSYSLGGSNPCQMWTNGSAAYVTDGHNVHTYNRVYGSVWAYSRNGVKAGHQLCNVTDTSLNCLFGIKFNEN